MKITVVATTEISLAGAEEKLPVNLNELWDITEADYLAEFGGRACYKSWDRPNPATATNETYLANILKQGHFSVLEHASASFYVEGASRALLLELERHRFLSFSVESQRYVDTAKAHPKPVMPPALKGSGFECEIEREYEWSLDAYTDLLDRLKNKGVKGKVAREAARAVLPNCTPVDFLVTGNMRAWRDVIGKRYSPAADAEIREFAGAILDHLKKIAPNSFQDFPEVSNGN